MSSTSSLQPESIDPDDLQRLVPIKNSLTKAGVWGQRINLQILDRTGVQQELGEMFGVNPEEVGAIAITMVSSWLLLDRNCGNLRT
jgi:hypothetical protein